MNREMFLKELERLLAELPVEEREGVLDYYGEYLEEAGDVQDPEILKQIGTPKQIAAEILAGIHSDGSEGAFTESGYQDERFRDVSHVPDRYAEIVPGSAVRQESGDRQGTENSGFHTYGSGDQSSEEYSRDFGKSEWQKKAEEAWQRARSSEYGKRADKAWQDARDSEYGRKAEQAWEEVRSGRLGERIRLAWEQFRTERRQESGEYRSDRSYQRRENDADRDNRAYRAGGYGSGDWTDPKEEQTAVMQRKNRAGRLLLICLLLFFGLPLAGKMIGAGFSILGALASALIGIFAGLIGLGAAGIGASIGCMIAGILLIIAGVTHMAVPGTGLLMMGGGCLLIAASVLLWAAGSFIFGTLLPLLFHTTSGVVRGVIGGLRTWIRRLMQSFKGGETE